MRTFLMPYNLKLWTHPLDVVVVPNNPRTQQSSVDSEAYRAELRPRLAAVVRR